MGSSSSSQNLLSPCHRDSLMSSHMDGPGSHALLGFVSHFQALPTLPGSLVFQKTRSFPGVGFLYSNYCGVNASKRTSLGTLPSPARPRLSLFATPWHQLGAHLGYPAVPGDQQLLYSAMVFELGLCGTTASEISFAASSSMEPWNHGTV